MTNILTAMSDANKTVLTVTGGVSGIAALDRGLEHFLESSFLTDLLGSGDALTVGMSIVTIFAIVYLVTIAGLVDFEQF